MLVTSLLLASIHIGMGFVWLMLYSYLVTRAGELRRPAGRRRLERVTGMILIGFGLRPASTSAAYAPALLTRG